MSSTTDPIQAGGGDPPSPLVSEDEGGSKPSELKTADGKVDMTLSVPPRSPAVEKETAVDAHQDSAQARDESEEDERHSMQGQQRSAAADVFGSEAVKVDSRQTSESSTSVEQVARARNVRFDADSDSQRQDGQVRGEYPKVGQNRKRSRGEEAASERVDSVDASGAQSGPIRASRRPSAQRRGTAARQSFSVSDLEEEAVDDDEYEETVRGQGSSRHPVPQAGLRNRRRSSTGDRNGSFSRRRSTSVSTISSGTSDGDTSSGPSDGDESKDPDRRRRQRSGKGGILSSMLRLYAPGRRSKSDDVEAQRGEVGAKQVLLDAERRAKAKMRRRWTEHTLFGSDSRTGSISEGNHRPHMMSSQEAVDEAVEGRDAEALSEVERESGRSSEPGSSRPSTSAESSRRSSTATLTDADQYRLSLEGSRSDVSTAIEPVSEHRHKHGLRQTTDREYRRRRHEMKASLNEPYIPAGRTGRADFLRPSVRLTMAQTLRGVVAEIQNKVSPGSGGEAVTRGSNRSIAALIITTSCMSAPASPQLAHFAPASGRNAESNTGRRKIVVYSNPREDEAREKAENVLNERAEAADLGQKVKPQEVADLQAEMLASTPLTRKERHSDRQRHTRGVRSQREIRITKHIADVISRENFILDLAKALVNLGAPTHTVESWLEATAYAIEVDASFIYFPSVLIVAFHDADVRSSSISLIKPLGGMDLYRLSLVHDMYRKVVHDDISVAQGSRALRRITRETKTYHWTILLSAGAIAAAAASGVAFSGSLLDMAMSGVLGLLIPIIQMVLINQHRASSNIFEIGAAGLIAFIGRGLGGSGYFCYNSVISASIVLILPGWMICLGSVEIGSRAVVPGAIRMVWSIVYTLFLSFALSIGTELFDLTGVTQPSAPETTADGSSIVTVDLTGTFVSNNTAFDNMFQSGVITISNGTASTSTLACYRNPDRADAVWYMDAPDWTRFLTVPALAIALAIWNRADWRSRDLPVMVVVASAGYVVNYVLSDVMSDQPNVVTAAAAFAIGLLANLYSRIWGGSAFPVMLVAILLEVPNSIVTSGGLSVSTSSTTDDSSDIDSAVLVSIRLVQSGISLAVGIFAAAAVVYPFGKRGRFTFSF